MVIKQVQFRNLNRLEQLLLCATFYSNEASPESSTSPEVDTEAAAEIIDRVYPLFRQLNPWIVVHQPLQSYAIREDSQDRVAAFFKASYQKPLPEWIEQGLVVELS